MKFTFLIFCFGFILVYNSNLWGNILVSNEKLNSLEQKIRFQTIFGNCPTRLIGNLSINIVEEFTKNLSLRDVKSKIIKENLKEKYFLSSYNIKYDPLKKLLYLEYDCPLPLLKVSVYEKNKAEAYQSILVENGKMFDPTYEIILKEENKLKHELPVLSLSKSEVEKDIQVLVASLMKKTTSRFRENIAELIISEEKELTIILSMNGKPISVFFGKDEWETKIIQLKRIVEYLNTKQKAPTMINLSNQKKIVVKF
ncbi:MAG: hypothetical protein HQK51_15355 [Oligoflexia bacterium]|nr:hypothetical protein [Oligoflexia bacterium]